MGFEELVLVKRQTRATLAGLTFLAIVGTGLFLFSRDEPKYGGKNITEWLPELFFKNYPQRDPEALHALQAMGQPAVLYLAKIAETDDSAITAKSLQYASRFPAIEQFVPTKYWWRYLAAKALGELATNASAAVPALEKMARHSDPNLSRVAAASLVLVRDQPIEELIAAYSTNSRAYGILMELGPHAKLAMPTLINELESTNSRVRIRAVIALKAVGKESPECVSVFTHLLSDTNDLVRSQAIDGLTACGDMAKSATPAVVRLLDDPSDSCQMNALMFLYQTASPMEFAPYQSKVQSLTASTNELTRMWAETVLAEKSSPASN